MDKAMLIAKENTPNENILSNSYSPAMDKNGLRSLQILQILLRTLCRLLELLWLAQSGCASSTCGFGKDKSSTLGLWSAYECPFIFAFH